MVRPRGKQRRLTRVKYNIAFENKGTGTPLSMGGNNGFSPRRLNQESSGARRIAVQKQLALSVAVGADDGRHHVRENGRQKEVRRRRKAPAHTASTYSFGPSMPRVGREKRRRSGQLTEADKAYP